MNNAPSVTAATGSRHARPAVNKSKGVSALLYACQQGDVEKVRQILRVQPNAYLERDRTGKSALHYCCTSDHISATQAADVLVMAAPDLLDSRDDDGFTPLHLAVIAGNIPLVTFLLANNADINAVDNEKHTVVHWATVCGETVALRAVLAAGAPVSTPDVHGGYPLHYAAQMCGGDKDSSLGLQILHTLLSHEDISVVVEDGDGRPPLLWAASAGSAKAILALIRAGSPVESHDKDGLTALHCAASRGHSDCIDTLLTLCGASPDVIDSNGCTALHYAVTLGHADATALLLAHAADPNRQDRKGRSPAHCGCAKGQFETVKLLGNHGANLWLRNARGDFPLHEAAASGRRDLVRWLLEARPSQVNARNNDGRCPLHLAALNDNADMCKILLDAGAQVNPVLRTSKNVFMTPLDCALQRGFRTTAKYLQLHGGVPSNRLMGISQGPGAGSAVSLQIRDDITLWGDTSSESEKEEVKKDKQEKVKKRSYKRKHAFKYEKKKYIVSTTDYDSTKQSNAKTDNEETKAEKDISKSNKDDVPHHADFPFFNGNKNIPPGEIFIYANEVNINDKFNGTAIKQNKEIVVSGLSRDNVNISEAIEEPKVISIKSRASSVKEKSEKRPKSAKYGRLKSNSGTTKNKSSISSANSQQTVVENNVLPVTNKNMLIAVNKSVDNVQENQQNTDAMPQPSESVTSLKENDDTLDSNDLVSRKEKLGIDKIEQESVRSNLSGEEEHREIVVEASIHEPPKGLEEEIEIQKNAVENPDPNDKEIVTTTDSKGAPENEVDEKVTKIEIEKQETFPDVINETTEMTETPSTTTDLKETTHELDETNDKLPPKVSYADAETNTANDSNINETVEDKVTTNEALDETVLKIDVEELNAESVEKSISNTTENKTEETNLEENKEVSELEKPIETNITDPVPEDNLTDSLVASTKLTSSTNVETSTPEEPKEPTKNEIPSESQNENNSIAPKDAEEEEPASFETKEQDNGSNVDIDSAPKLELSSEAEIENSEKQKVTYNKSKKTSKHPEKLSNKSVDVTQDTQYAKSSEETDEELSPSSLSQSSTLSVTEKKHKSFKILDDGECPDATRTNTAKHRKLPRQTNSHKKQSSKSEGKQVKRQVHYNEHERLKRSKIPTPVSNLKSSLSKSERYLERYDRNESSNLEPRVPSLPNINASRETDPKHVRSISNLSAPLVYNYSDNDRETGSDVEEINSATRKKRLKKRSKTRDAKSAGSDYESSNLIDSGFEPSPRSTRIPKWKNMSERGANMTSVTQTIQSNIRRYHLERKIFQHLLDLKRLQIRSGQHDETVLVKRAIDAYHKSCAATVGAGRYVPQDYTFKGFEMFLYNSLRKIQKNGIEHLRGLPETPKNPLLCTQSTHRCDHATHAYTGVPCAAYLPRINHHSIPKIGFDCKPSGYLPKIGSKNAVTLELCHGNDTQVISLPAERLDQNKRYYVTFTVKGNENYPSNSNEEINTKGSSATHVHSKSD